MKNDIYLNAKQLVKSQAKELKRLNTDKPYIREVLNNLCDDLCKQFNWYAMKERISEKQAALYSVWLASFTADMHP
jgi:hypothetical protein